MAKGKLSNLEKYAIQGMLHEGKTHKNIAEQLGRTETTITKYVEKELTPIQETVAAVQMSEVEEEFEATMSEEIRVGTLKKLRQAGLSKRDAEELLDRTLNKLKFDPDNDAQMYSLCIRNMNAKDLMGTEAVHGQTGVAIMTKAASEKCDERRKSNANLPSRSSRGKIFLPKEGKMRDDGEV